MSNSEIAADAATQVLAGSADPDRVRRSGRELLAGISRPRREETHTYLKQCGTCIAPIDGGVEFILETRTALARLARLVRSFGGLAAERSPPKPPQPDLRHEIVTDPSILPALARDWDALLLRSGRNELPCSYAWHSIWWRHFGRGRQLRVHCFYVDDRLIAIAPMLLESTRYRGIPARRMTAMANGHSPYFDLLLDPDVGVPQLREIVTRIVASASADVIAFTRVPERSVLGQLLRTGSRLDRYRFGATGGLTTPLVRIDSDWETFFAARSQKFRKNLRNKANRFQRTEGCRIERRQLRSPDDPALAEMVRISKNSWKGKAGTDLGSTPGSRPFLADLIAALGPAGGTEVWIARCGQEPIAYEFHASHGGITYPLRADFDERYREISPGSVVEYTALRDLFDERRRMLYDSCANNYWYLSNWTDEYRTHFDFEIFGRSFRSRLLYTLEYRVVPLLRRLRDIRRKGTPRDSAPPSSH